MVCTKIPFSIASYYSKQYSRGVWVLFEESYSSVIGVYYSDVK
jgi:hypothetical protein